ncbi:MAG: adenylate/guanylate cyclase domain-containing protein, partial [Actinomycetota bacterium]
SLPASRLDDPRLARAAELIESSGWAAELYDEQWRLLWISTPILELMGIEDESIIGYGRHILDHVVSEPWSSAMTPESSQEMLRIELPMIISATPGGKESLKRSVDPVLHDLIDAAEPAEPPLVWAHGLDFIQGDLDPVPVNSVCVRLWDPNDGTLGWLTLYGPGLPATILSLVARGDRGVFERLARLVEPGRRDAAIMFADLEDSGVLSRRLPSAVYFRLIGALIGAIDGVVAEHGGIVGKHAGDGASAFFLAEDLGSSSAAAGAAVAAARDVAVVSRETAKLIAEETGAFDSEDCRVNIGLHWGGQLYMGQLVTGGRLEVTALGDAVNECARIQESARGGRTLASKPLVEHLELRDSEAVGVDPDSVGYAPLEELPEAGEKARRDAGTIPVTAL